MKVDKRIPLVHIGQIVAPLKEAGCTGSLTFIEGVRRVIPTRKKGGLTVGKSRWNPDEEWALPEAVWNEILDAMHVAFGEQEKEVEEYAAKLVGHDCTAFYRFYYYLLAVIPSLKPSTRDLLDEILGHEAEEWAKVT